MKPQAETGTQDKGKEKIKLQGSESAPITRQGYMSGMLAENFWETLDIPDTPLTPRKKLRVLPLLTKNQDHKEFLVDNSKQPPTPITTIHIAEVLAGIPWTTIRVRQHVVNEIAQGLLKVLIFNNQHNTPFQKWSQGRWQSCWTPTAEGEQLCTLIVTIAAPERKIRIRKGKNLKWKPIPPNITEVLTCENTEKIHAVGEYTATWHEMTGIQELTPHNPPAHHTTAVMNSFSALLDAEVNSS